MKPSTKRLFGMLPRVVCMRHEVIGGRVANTVVLDGVTGKPTGLDPRYPGFAENLLVLVKMNLVIDAGASFKGSYRNDTPFDGTAEQVLVSMNPKEKVGSA